MLAGTFHPSARCLGAERAARSVWILLLVMALGACSSLPTDFERTASYAIEDGADTSLGRQLQPMLDDHPDLSGFFMLSEGEDAFAVRLALILAAEKSLDVQYYIWHDDLTGGVVYSLLMAAADRGVRVRLLLDDLDTAGKNELLRRADAHPNLEVRLFNPFSDRNSRGRDFLTDARRINHRMHNKTLTADTLATIYGGRNIGDEYFSATKGVAFGDLDALAVGPIAEEVSSQFDLYWNSEVVYPLSAFASAPLSDEELNEFRAQSDANLEAAGKSEYANVIRKLELAQLASISELEFIWSEWLLAYDQPDKINNDEVLASTHLAPKLKKGMDNAREELIIVSPYFVPGKKFTEYLVGRVADGVSVRILTNSLEANDVPMVHAGYMRYRKDLVAWGVELYEYRVVGSKEMRKQQAKKDRIGASGASLHAKFFGFDQRYLFVGSFNLDARSVAINTELGAYFESTVLASRLSQRFDEDILDMAYKVELEEGSKLVWISLDDNGREVRVYKEPDTTGWKRFSTRFLSLIVPESQL
jgi:putative cardiolipin synthase